jgi:hypothetical protein
MIRNKSPWCLFLSSFSTDNKTLKKRSEKEKNQHVTSIIIDPARRRRRRKKVKASGRRWTKDKSSLVRCFFTT